MCWRGRLVLIAILLMINLDELGRIKAGIWRDRETSAVYGTTTRRFLGSKSGYSVARARLPDPARVVWGLIVVIAVVFGLASSPDRCWANQGRQPSSRAIPLS